jgi:Zn-finger nucleic acid-binding protein
MRCPRCEAVVLDEREREGVVVDACPRCRGVWLDRGELEKIVSRAAEWETEGAGWRRDRDDDRYEGRYEDRERYDDDRYREGRHRRGGWQRMLREIFD